MKKLLIITGDPNSINSELIIKSWKKISKQMKRRIVFISNYALLKQQFKKLKYKVKITPINNLNNFNSYDDLKIINVDLNFKNPFNVDRKQASNFFYNSLDKAHKLALKKNVSGIITCPIDKRLLKMKKIGVTEVLAFKSNIKDNSEVMLIKNKKLSVCPITTHDDIKNVSRKLNKKLLINKIKTIHNWFWLSLKQKPKIAILGLNPHNAELKKNSEEKKIIIPSIKELKKFGIDVVGPLVADTLFIEDYKNFDVIIGMYHDQVLAPFKSIFKFKAINLTLGLKYLRASPDHGVAINLIGKNKANPTSLIECINFFNKF